MILYQECALVLFIEGYRMKGAWSQAPTVAVWRSIDWNRRQSTMQRPTSRLTMMSLWAWHCWPVGMRQLSQLVWTQSQLGIVIAMYMSLSASKHERDTHAYYMIAILFRLSSITTVCKMHTDSCITLPNCEDYRRLASLANRIVRCPYVRGTIVC